MKNPFCSLAEKFYPKENQKIEKELLQLHPDQNGKKLYGDYQTRKFATVLVVLAIGMLSALCLHLSSRIESRLVEGTQIKRNEWGVGNYEITLRAKTEEWSREISFLIEERKLTEEEKDTLLKELQKKLPELIKKDNQDLQHVVSDLNLLSFVAGYPFRITWNSADSERINDQGKVNRTNIPKEGACVVLTAVVAYEEEKNNFVYEVILPPEEFDDEEIFYRLLEDDLQAAEQKEPTNSSIILPENLYGKQIKWEEVRENRSVLLLLVFILGSVMICRAMDNDLKRNCEKRKKQLLMDYSGFVSKLRLYLSAGLTVKNTFIKMEADGRKNQSNQKMNYLYEEMKIACHQLENGMMEEQVYQEFGSRCGEMRYRRLGSLLSVHLKQGNDQLLRILEREADSALEDRKNLAKKAGEEAGTKLLFPMMLMLIVVMFLILLPAYFNFGSI